MSAGLNVPDRMTLEEFLTWDAPGPGLWQLIDGVPQAMAPAGSTHGVIQSNIATAITNHLDQRGGPCVMMTNPGIIPAFQSNRNFFIPDAAVTCSDSDIGVPGICTASWQSRFARPRTTLKRGGTSGPIC